MSEAYSNPYPPEYHEQKVLDGLLGVLHVHHDNARQLQLDQREAHDRALQPLRLANYVVEFRSEAPQIPAMHDRIIFGPQYNSPQYEGIARIIARFPIAQNELLPEHTETSEDGSGDRVPTARPWNDIFLEVIDEKGVRQNYLLNGKGLHPFDTTDDVADERSFEKTDDLFDVFLPSVAPKVPLDMFTLSYLLTYRNDNPDCYVYHQQTNEIDPPRFF